MPSEKISLHPEIAAALERVRVAGVEPPIFWTLG